MGVGVGDDGGCPGGGFLSVFSPDFLAVLGVNGGDKRLAFMITVYDESLVVKGRGGAFSVAMFHGERA